MESLKYHQAALDFIGEAPIFSEQNIQDLNKFEQKFNLKLPPSLREWLSLELSGYILSKYSNGDGAIEAKELMEYYPELLFENPDYCAPFDPKYFLPVMIENQGCFYWHTYLDGSDDPPVYVTGNKLELYTRTFSDFVFTHVWDWNGLFSQMWFPLFADSGQEKLDFMRQHFEETARTYSFDYVGGAAYRFFNGDKSVLIKTGADYDTWHLWASSLKRVGELIEFLKQHIQFRDDIKIYPRHTEFPPK
ncbi:MAG TPA: SMI1/KNR4 family protein [Chloroflexia bacterium]|nr:SMI1/KNR4 family protein [Chloroflexia bacterium]